MTDDGLPSPPPHGDTPAPAALPLLSDHAPRREVTLELLARIARAEIVEMALAGELRPAHLWTAMDGGMEYLVAWAAGDRAGEDEQLRRLATCRACEHRTVSRKNIRAGGAIALDAWYCGPKILGSRNPDGSERTCGCLVGISIDGEALDRAGGKVLVGSQCCPQGRW